MIRKYAARTTKHAPREENARILYRNCEADVVFGAHTYGTSCDGCSSHRSYHQHTSGHDADSGADAHVRSEAIHRRCSSGDRWAVDVGATRLLRYVHLWIDTNVCTVMQVEVEAKVEENLNLSLNLNLGFQCKN